MSNKVTELAPTSGIDDPQVRAFCDSLANAWGLRNGTVDRDGGSRFITKDEFQAEVVDALNVLLGSQTGPGVGAPGFPNTPTDGTGDPPYPPGWSVQDGYRELVERIRASMLWRKLEEQIITDRLIPAIRENVVPLKSTAYQAVTTAGAAQAGLDNEITARVSNIGALVQVVNTMWATFGAANQAVVWDGQSATANAVSSDARSWEGVMAAVRDPNTNQIATASILEESRTYANNTDNQLNAAYTLRVELDPGTGDPIVGGFGILGSYSNSGQPTIDFGVRADTFWIGSPSNGNRNVPFIVTTGPETIDGIDYPDGGVWMNAAMICEATIDVAKISKVIHSTNFNGTYDKSAGTVSTSSPGTTGWALGQDGNAVFNNVRIRGTSYVERLRVEGSVSGSFLLDPAASDGTVYGSHTHNEGRNVQLTYWSDFGTPSIAYMDENAFSIRSVGYSGTVNIYWSYW